MAKQTSFEDLAIGDCFAFSAEARTATRRKVSARHAAILPHGKRPLTVDDIEARVHARSCPTAFGRPARTRCELFATAKPRGKRLEYAGGFTTCAAAHDYAKWLRASGHKARVKRVTKKAR